MLSLHRKSRHTLVEPERVLSCAPSVDAHCKCSRFDHFAQSGFGGWDRGHVEIDPKPQSQTSLTLNGIPTVRLEDAQRGAPRRTAASPEHARVRRKHQISYWAHVFFWFVVLGSYRNYCPVLRREVLLFLGHWGAKIARSERSDDSNGGAGESVGSGHDGSDGIDGRGCEYCAGPIVRPTSLNMLQYPAPPITPPSSP